MLIINNNSTNVHNVGQYKLYNITRIYNGTDFTTALQRVYNTLQRIKERIDKE